jgi:aminotransferase
MPEAAAATLVERVMSRRARELGQGFPRQTSVPTSGFMTLSSGTPDFPVPPHILDGAKQALDRGETVYTPWAGIPELRRAIAAKLAQDNGITVDPDTDVLVTTGTQEALQVVCQALLDPGDEILVSAPYYDEYRRDALMAGARLVPVSSRQADNFVIDVDALAAHITERTKAVIVISPSNPTGAVQSRAVLERVAALAAERNLVVIADELYEKYVYEGHRHHSIAAMPGMFERTVTINGFSKAFAMTGFRIGYIAAPAEFVRAMLPIKHGMTICAPSISQWAAVAALTGPRDWFDGVLAEYDRRRHLWMEALDGMGLSYGWPQGAYYIYINVGATGLAAAEFGRRVREEYGLVIGSGGRIGPEWDSYVRGSFAVPTETLRKGLARLAEAVRRYRGARA